jgi:hypothetical protein
MLDSLAAGVLTGVKEVGGTEKASVIASMLKFNIGIVWDVVFKQISLNMTHKTAKWIVMQVN